MEDNQVSKQPTHEEGECSENEELAKMDNQCENSNSESRNENPKEGEGSSTNKRHKSRHSKSEHTASRGVYQELYLRLCGIGRLSDLPRYVCIIVCMLIVTCVNLNLKHYDMEKSFSTCIWHGVNFSQHDNVSRMCLLF